MYIVDLIKRLTSKQNIPVLIYLILNVFVTGFLLYLFPAMFGMNPSSFLPYLGAGFVIYLVSVLIALSPIGEFIIRLQTGCKKIKRVEQKNFLEPIFREVYDKAKQADPSIPDDVQFFMNSDETPNAFATGRKTICVTEGLLHVPESQIRATLGHEFGHIAHKDTDLIMLVSVGNLIVSGFILFLRVIIGIIQLCMSIASLALGGSEGAVARAMTALGNLLVTAIIAGLTKLWTKLGVWLVMKSSRENEYGADEFSFNLGYGNDLCVLLDSIDESGAKGLFATLASSHPDKDDRIARLQELGATYRTTYGNPNQRYTTEPDKGIEVNASVPSMAMGFTSGTVVQPHSNSFESVQMVACPKCGGQIMAGSKFCSSCGATIEDKTPIKLVCPNCGTEAEEEDSVFCEKCGSKLIP